MNFVSEIQAILDRASENLVTFHNEVTAYIEAKPYELVTKVYSKGENTRLYFVFLVKINTPIPDRLPLLAGEVVHGLRTALDHMIYALSYNHTIIRKRKFIDLDGARTEFPIFDNPAIFSERIKNGRNRGKPTPRSGLFKIRYTAPEVQAIIKFLQPYNAVDYRQSYLWILQNLDNINKHRRLNVMGLPAGKFLIRTPPDTFIVDSDYIAKRPLEDGAIFARGTLVALTGQAHVRMERELITQISLHERFLPTDTYTGWLLQDVFHFVESNVLNTLVTFL